MDTIGPSGVVTNSTGDVGADGQIVGIRKENGTSLQPPRYRERDGLDERMRAAGQDPAVMRRMLGLAAACRCRRRTCRECRARLAALELAAVAS